MMGKKAASTIQAELLKECAKAGINPATWFDEQIRKLENGKSPNPQEIETLKLIRDGLQEPPRRKPGRKKAVRRSPKVKSRKSR